MENPAALFRFIKRNNAVKQVLLFFLFFITACNNGDNDVSVEHAGNFGEGNGTEADIDFFPELSAFYKKQYPAYDPSLFEMTGELRDLAYITSPMDEDRLRKFKPLLIYNSDSSLALDVYSNSYIAVMRQGHTSFESGEPDTEVAIIDFRNKTRKRIFYTGPSFAVLDVKWLNDSVVALAGAMPVGTDQAQPQIHKILLSDGVQEIYELRDTIPVALDDFIDQKIKMKLSRSGKVKEF